jgi:hypothetical protein
MTQYWLVYYRQRWLGRPDWQTANEVIKGCPGTWFHGVLTRNNDKAESQFLSATPITAASFKLLKGEL